MAEKGAKRSIESNDLNEKFFDIGKNKRITVRKFKNVRLVDIREFYEAGGELKPGKKGISLTEDQWNVLVENIEDIKEALSELDDNRTTKKARTPKKEQAGKEDDDHDDANNDDE